MELVIFIGLQASGKSTFYAQHFAGTHEHVSKDRMRNNKNRARRQAHLIEAALQAGRSVVVDNTNPSVEERASIIQLGRQWDADIIGYYFESRLSQCLERNQQRSGKSRVPDVALYATIKRLVRPTYAEGFDRLYYVPMAGDLAFDVHPWREGEAAYG